MFWHDFSLFFCKLYENVLPTFGGKHISESRFLPTSCTRRSFHTQNGFKTSTLGGTFPSCAVQKIIVFADWAENGPPGKLSFTSLLISHAFWSRFSKFRDWFCYNLWKTLPVLVAKHSTFGEAITAWHEACVGTFTHAYPYSAKINANYPPLQRLFFRCWKAPVEANHINLYIR